jgi:hypothetical protein
VTTLAEAGSRRSEAASRMPAREVIRSCVLAFVGARVLVGISVALAGTQATLRAQGVPGWPAPPLHPGWTEAFSALERFDALWFLRIASGGYRFGDGSAAFFPLFPLATRAVSYLIGGHPLAASLLVSNGGALAASILLFRLTEDELGARFAPWTIVWLSVFPTAYFLVLPYSESLFLLCVVAAFLAARRRAWVLAALAAALAASTRSIGIALVPALALEAWHQRAEGRGSALPGLAAAGAGALGTLAYAAWWQARDGDWLIPLVRQQNWQRGFSPPWTTLWNGARIAVEQFGHPGGGYWVLDVVVVAVVLALCVVVAVRMRPAYAAYTWASLLAPMTFVFAGRPLMSMPRFVLTLFPIAWVLAGASVDRPWLGRGLLGASAVAFLVLCSLTVNWFYVF